jgi:hypothetical protein
MKKWQLTACEWIIPSGVNFQFIQQNFQQRMTKQLQTKYQRG